MFHSSVDIVNIIKKTDEKMMIIIVEIINNAKKFWYGYLLSNFYAFSYKSMNPLPNIMIVVRQEKQKQINGLSRIYS